LCPGALGGTLVVGDTWEARLGGAGVVKLVNDATVEVHQPVDVRLAHLVLECAAVFWGDHRVIGADAHEDPAGMLRCRLDGRS